MSNAKPDKCENEEFFLTRLGLSFPNWDKLTVENVT